MVTRVMLHHYPQESLQALELLIGEELDKAFDLKNQRIAELERRFDTLDRQAMVLDRRLKLSALRRKKR